MKIKTPGGRFDEVNAANADSTWEVPELFKNSKVVLIAANQREVGKDRAAAHGAKGG